MNANKLPPFTAEELEQKGAEAARLIAEACNEAAAVGGPEAALLILRDAAEHIEDWIERNRQ